jgi:hypothetical protein
MFRKRTMFCESYTGIHVLMSLIKVSDSDVPTTSSYKQCDLLLVTDPTIFTPIFPHIYQDNFYNSAILAQTLLDRIVRVYGTRRAERGIPCDLDGEGRCLKKGKSAFRRNGDVMVQVWKDKTCANVKYHP